MTGLAERDQAVGERRGLMMRLYAAAAAALVAAAPSLLVGLFTAVTHVALPIRNLGEETRQALDVLPKKNTVSMDDIVNPEGAGSPVQS